MAHITRISAGKSKRPDDDDVNDEPKVVSKVSAKNPTPKDEKPKKEHHGIGSVLTAPFRAIGRYFKESWQELRQVRWPNRKATWKLVLAVFIYTALFLALIILLDVLFTFIFSKILA